MEMDLMDDGEEEDEAPEWMQLLKGPKQTIVVSTSALPPKGKLVPAASAAETGFAPKVSLAKKRPFARFQEPEDEEEEVPAPTTPIAAPSTPPAEHVQEALADHRHIEARINQLALLLFADKALSKLRLGFMAYLRQRSAQPAFPRRLVLLRGPPGAGSAQWAMQALQQGHAAGAADALSQQLAHVCAAADFFGEMRDGKWEASVPVDKIQEETGRALNEARLRLSMELGLEPLYLDGTNVWLWEMRPYVTMAERLGYVVSVVEPGEVCLQWDDVDFLLSRQSQFGRAELEAMIQSFEGLSPGSNPRPVILAAERPAEEDEEDDLADRGQGPVVLPPTALLYKLERLLAEGSELLRYVPPDGDGWGVNGELSSEWQHFRERADGSCCFDDRTHWRTRLPENGGWSLAELTLLAELRRQASDLPLANLPSAVSHPALFAVAEDSSAAASAAAAAIVRTPASTESPAPPASRQQRLQSARQAVLSPSQKAVDQPARSAVDVPASRLERLRQRVLVKKEQEEAEGPGGTNGGSPEKRRRLTAMAEGARSAAAEREESPEREEVAVSEARPGEPTEDEEVSASTFLGAVKSRLLEWGKVEQYHEFVLALSGSVDARAAVRILRGHDDLVRVFQRKFAPKADLAAIKAEIKEEEMQDAPRPPPRPPSGPGVVKQELREPRQGVKQELGGGSAPRPPATPPPPRGTRAPGGPAPRAGIKAELGVKAEVKLERPEAVPRPPAYGPNEARPAVTIGDDSDDEALDEVSIATAVKRGRDECVAQLAKTIFRNRFDGNGARLRLSMTQYASRVAAKPRFPRELIILRGAPGVGKTEYAMTQLAELAGFEKDEETAARLTHICAADDFFETSSGRERASPVYKCEPHRLESCHGRNEVRARLAMEAGIHPIFVDCTNLRLWEMRPYVLLADRLGQTVADPGSLPNLQITELVTNQHRNTLEDGCS
ncbi:unnamed protein product [Polarella glacialis]|uniref:2',3'-cyclic-nucleotide 3'-phosphodiesterase n=1 Tax=Polarella glacialis TaxID=89957 RepID=A0A813DX98_POLGL|nr:unnamed protein product [Polarella glacialis]